MTSSHAEPWGPGSTGSDRKSSAVLPCCPRPIPDPAKNSAGPQRVTKGRQLAGSAHQPPVPSLPDPPEVSFQLSSGPERNQPASGLCPRRTDHWRICSDPSSLHCIPHHLVFTLFFHQTGVFAFQSGSEKATCRSAWHLDSRPLWGSCLLAAPGQELRVGI